MTARTTLPTTARDPEAVLEQMRGFSADDGRPVKMTQVRTRAIRALADAFSCEQYHIYTDHPILNHVARRNGALARAS